MIIKIYPIGKIIKYMGIRLQILKAVQDCRGCYFRNKRHCPASLIGACTKPWRDEDIIFRKFDKNRKENLHGRSKNNRNIG